MSSHQACQARRLHDWVAEAPLLVARMTTFDHVDKTVRSDADGHLIPRALLDRFLIAREPIYEMSWW